MALLVSVSLVLSLLTALSIAQAASAPPAAAAVGGTNCTPEPGYTGCTAFIYGGSLDSFTVPANVTSLKVKAWGAGGGGVDANFSTVQAGGGGGGYATALMTVTPGQNLSILVGQGGRSGINGSLGPAFGNGGAGGAHGNSGSASSDGGGGGGYSGVANNTDFTAAGTVLIAAGGGGAGPSTMTGTPASGGGGGATGGQSTAPASTGRGGAATAGGAAAATNTSCTAATSGSKLAGGSGGTVTGTTQSTPNAGGGGGGGGWYGGGGGRCGNTTGTPALADQAGSGGGGSSYTGATGLSGGSTDAGINGGAGSPGQAGAAGDNGDSQYAAGVGTGGPVTVAGGGNGGDGRVVLEWNLGYSIAKAALSSSATPGGTLTYKLTITNTSTTAYTAAGPAGFSDNLTGVLDDATYNNDAASSVTGWTFSGTSALTGSGPLAVGQTATITYSVTVKSPDPGNLALSNVVAPSRADGSCGASCATTTPVVTSAASTCSPAAYARNGSFEAPAIPAGAGTNVAGGSSPLIWDTTVPSNNIEMWANGGSSQSNNGNIAITAQEGSQWVELNSDAAGALYQDIPTVAGQVLAWSVWHRARGVNGNTTGQDVMRVQIGTTTSQTAQIPTGKSSTNISDGPLAWSNYTGSYTVPAGQTTTRFQMTAVSTFSGNTTVGNFIDNISVGTSACLSAATTAANQTAGAGTLTRPKDALQYTVTATNNGGVSSGGSILTAAVPAGTSYVPGSLVIGGVAVSDASGDDAGQVSGSTVTARIGSGATSSAGGAVAVNASVAISYKVTVDDSVTAGTVLAGSGNISYLSPPATASKTAVATTVTSPVSAPAIGFTTTVDRSTDVNANGRLDAGDQIKYQFAVTDTGSVAVTGISVTDNKVGTVACPATSLAVGASVICTASYTATSADATAGSVVNTATASATPPSGAAAIASAPSSVTTPMYIGALSVSTTASNSSVSAVGQNTVFTTVVTNGGNTTLTAVNITAVLTSPAGPNPDSASCSVAQPTTLAPGASYTCTANYAARQADLDNSKITGTATVVGTTPQSTTVTAATSTSVAVQQNPGLSLTSTATPTKVTAAGQTISYSFAVTNTGNTTINGLSITDGFTAPAGPVPAISCAATTVAPGATTSCTAVTYTVLGADITAGQITNTATAKGTSSSGAAVISAPFSVSVVADPPVISFTPAAGEVAVAYSQQPTVTGGIGPFTWQLASGTLPTGVTLTTSTGLLSGPPSDAGNFSFTLSVRDSKNAVATRTASIFIAALPTFTFGTPATPQVGIAYSTAFTLSGGTGPAIWSISAGTLPPGLTLDPATGSLSGTPTASGSYPFTVQAVDANNKSTTKSTSLAPTAGPLVITTTANVASTTAGGTVVYTITIANSSSTAFSGVAISNPLTGVLDDATYNSNAAVTGGGSVSYASSTVSWTGTVGANATVSITYSITVNNPDTGDKLLVNSVSSATVGANCGSGNADVRCTATVAVASLAIAQSTDVASTVAGGTVRYTIVVTNTGQSAYTGATVTENLSDVLDDAAYNTNASATSGSVTFTGPSLSWTGNLAVGASATITYTVTVANPDTGNRILAATVVSTTTGSTCPTAGPATSCTTSIQSLITSLTVTNVAAPVSPVLLGHWTFDEGSGTTAADTAGNNPATLSGGAGWGAGTQGPFALALNGGGGVADTGAAVLDTSGSFSVSVTVKLNNLNGYQTFVGQDGSEISSFFLQLRGDTHKIAFTRLAGDSTSATNVAASALAAPVVGQWYQLTGVYDASAATLALYINGVLQQRVAAPTGWNATGHLVIGRGKSNFRANDLVNGVIDDVQVYRGVLYPGTATTVPGATVPLTAVIANTGQTAYGSTSVVINLSAATDDAVYNNDATASSGTLSYNAAAATLTWTGVLPIGSIVTVNSTMTVRNPDPGDKNLLTVATSTAAGSSCPAGSSTTGCSAAVAIRVPALTISKTADVSSTTPGSLVTYTINLTNSGQTDYQSSTFVDSLAGVLDDATYQNDVTASVGTAVFNSQQLTWTGALAIGASATVRYSVVVNNPDTGNRTLSSSITSSTAGNICSSGDTKCLSSIAVLLPGMTITNVAAPVSPVLLGHWTFDEGSGTTAADTAGSRPAILSGGAGWGAGIQGGSALSDNGGGFADSGAAVLDTAGSFSVSARVKLSNVNGYQTFISQDGTNVSGFFLELRADTGKFAFVRLAADSTSAATTYASAVANPSVGQWYLLTGVYDTSTGTLALYVDGQLQQRVAAPTGWNATGHLVVGRGQFGGATDFNNANIDDVQVYRGVLYPGPATTVPGAAVPLTTVIANTGQTAYGSSTTVVVNLSAANDDATYNNDATASAGSVTYNAAAGTLTWTGSLAVGAVVTVSATMTVRRPQAGDKSLTSAANSTAVGNNCAAGSRNAACTATVQVLIPALTITKTADVSSVVTGGTVNYTIVVQNTGQSAFGAASFTDSLATVLPDATYSGGATASVGTVSYTAPALSWSGALAMGAVATITYSVTVRDPDPGNKRLLGTVVSTTDGSNCPSGGSDTRCTSDIPVLVPALTLVTTPNQTATAPGGVVSYVVTVTNSGQTAYIGATFVDSMAGVLDDASYNTDVATTGGGTVTGGPSGISWTGDLAVGATVSVSYSVTVKAADVGDDVLTNSVVSTTKGSNCAAGGIDTRCTSSVPVARLLIVQGSVPATTTPGSVVARSITFTNTGKVPYTDIRITNRAAGEFDDVTPNGDGAVTSGALSFEAGALVWTGSIAVGASVTVGGSFTVNDPDTGDHLVTSTWESSAPGTNCPTGSLDSRCTSAIRVLIPGLAMSVSSGVTQVTPGDTVNYVVTARNTGETAYPGATLSAALAGVFDDATYNNDAAASSTGQFAFSGSTSSWTGDIAIGATVTITFSVTVRSPDPADKTLSISVSSDAAGSTCRAGTPGPSCSNTVTVLTPGLTIVKTLTPSAVTLGGVADFSVTVTNSGQTAYAAATFTDDLSGVTDDAVLSSGPSATSGSASAQGSSVVWTGGLAVGASATVTYSFRVRLLDLGDRSLASSLVSATTGSNCASGSIDSRCSNSTPVVNAATLTFKQSADVSSTSAGGAVRFTDAVTNNSRRVVSADFTDSLTGILDDAAYVGSAASAGTLVYSAPGLSWSGTLAPGATVTVTYDVTVGSSAVNDDSLLIGQISSTSAPGSNNCPPDGNASACSSTVPVARLQLQQYAAETTATPGSVIHLTQVYTNVGKVPYSNITVSSPRADTSDDTTPTGDQQATSGTIVRTSTSVDWTGDVPVGGVVTVTRSLLVLNPDTGNKRVTARLASTAPGNNCAAGGADPQCTFLVTVLVPALTIAKTSNVTTAQPGDTIVYTVSIVDNGQADYTGITVTDTLTGVLDDATFNNDVSPAGATLIGSVLTWTGDLAVGASATFTYSVTVNSPDAGDKVLASAVRSSAPGSTCQPASAAAACGSAVVGLTPALTVVKSSSATNATLGSTVTYSTVVTNTGQTVYSAASFTDDLAGVLDDATVAQSPTLTGPGSLSYTGGVVSWSGALNPGDSATISFSVSINSPSTGDRAMTDRATSSTTGNNCDSMSVDSRCTSTVTVTNAVTLTFTKTADVLHTVAGATVHYTVTVRNAGLDAIGAQYTDPLAGILDNATYNGDATADDGNPVMLSGAELHWAGTIPGAGTVTVTYSVIVDNSVSGDKVLSGTVSSSSSDVSNNCLSGSTDPRCSNAVPIARLRIEQDPVPATVTPGTVLPLSVTFTNEGAYAYKGITISSPGRDLLDDVTGNGDQHATSGTLAVNPVAIVWTGDIPVGGSVTLGATVVVNDPPTGDRMIRSSWESAAPGNNCPVASSDPVCTAETQVVVPGLTVGTAASTTAAGPGDTVGYTVTITNSGETAHTGATVADSLAGVLDDATIVPTGGSTATATAGSVSLNPTTSVLTWTGDLAPGAVVVVTFAVAVRSPDPGDKNMSSTLTANEVGSNCPVGSTAAGCSSSVQVLTPALTITKTASVGRATLGSVVSYTVVVVNSGQTNYPAASLRDDLGQTLDDATFGSVSANASFDPGTKVVTWSGALAVDASATISYSVRVGYPAAGDGTMSSALTSTAAGNDCPAGGTDPRCAATVSVIDAPTLSFRQTADVASTVGGGTVHFTDAVTNNSVSDITGATFTDALTAILDDASYVSSVASSGTLTVEAGSLSWTGTIAAGATVTVTYTVTAAGVDTGDLLLTGSISSASAPGSNNCGAGSADPACATTVPVARLEIARHVTVATATPGTLLHLPVTIANTGQVPYFGITVSILRGDTSDDLEARGSDVATSGTLVRTTAATVWTGDIPVGTTVTITIDRYVRDPDPGNKIITAPLVSDAPGNNCPADSSDPRCTFSITVLVPGLTLSTTSDVATAQPGGTVNYTVVVTNSGQTPYSSASFTDELTSLLDDATLDGGATVTGGGLLTITSSGLSWAGSLDRGAAATVRFSATVSTPDPGDKSMVTTLSSATVGSSCPVGGVTATCRTAVTVLTPALTVTSAADSATSVPGAVVGFTITAKNTGQTDYSSAVVRLPLSGILDDATYRSDAVATTSPAGLVVSAGVLTWTGPLAVGDSTTITFSVQVNARDTGDHELLATVTSTDTGTNCPAGTTDPRCATDVPIASLQLIDAVDVSTTSPTSVVHFTGTFVNNGKVAYQGITVINSFVRAVDDATYNGDATATSGDVVIVVGSGRVVWTGDIAVGQTVTVTGSVTVNNPDSGDKVISTRLLSTAAGNSCPSGSVDPVCSTTTVVLIPALTITTAADRTTTTPGSTVQYTITVGNTGPVAYPAATVNALLAGAVEDAAYNNDAAADSPGTFGYAGSTLSWTGAVAIGQTVVITYSMTVANPDTGDKSLVAQVDSDAVGSTCPSGGGPGCTSIVGVLVPALNIAIAADRTTTTPGTVVEYTVTIANTGETPYLGAAVNIDLTGALDDATLATERSATIGVVTPTASGLQWTGDLPISTTTVITYSVVVRSPDPGNHSLVTAVSSAEAGGTCTALAPCGDTVTVLIPGISLSTTSDVASVTPGDVVTFTVTLTNTGETDYAAASFTSSLAGVIDDGNVSAVTATTGIATYAAATLSWTGDLAVGAVAKIFYTVSINNPDGGDEVVTATVVSPDAGSTCSAGSTDPGCTRTVVVKIPVLTITKTAVSGSTTTPGSVVSYRITIDNTGQTGYAGAVVSDSLIGVLADSTYNEDAVVSGAGEVAFANSTVTWTGGLQMAETATVTYSVTVLEPDPGDKTIRNSVSSSAPGSTCPAAGTGTGCSAVVRVLVPALTVTQTADVAQVVAGSPVHYTIRLTNTGETAYTPAALTSSLTGVLDDAGYGGDAAVSPVLAGTVSFATGTGEFGFSGNLAAGDSATVTYSVTTAYPATGDHTLKSSVVLNAPGSSCRTGAEAGCSTSVQVLVPALTITMTTGSTSAVAGGDLSYQISAENTGQADYSSATITDSLAGLGSNAAYAGNATAGSGLLSYQNDVLTWTGPLASGDSVLITFMVHVDVLVADQTVLVNAARSANIGSTCTSAAPEPICSTATTIAARSLLLSVSTPSFTLTGPPGATVSQLGAIVLTVTTNSTSGYTVTVEPTSDVLRPQDQRNTDTIPVGLVGVRQNGNGMYQALLSGTPLTVYEQNAPSAAGGDDISNDYQVKIPQVTADTYTGTLEYIVSAQ